MKILVVGEVDSWFDQTITASLQDLGHSVSVFHYGHMVGEYYSRARRSERESKNRDLLKQATALKADHGLDLIFCYVYDDFLEEVTAAALSKLGVPMVNYNVDMTNQWYRQIRTARYFTTMLCAQRIHMPDLARYGASVYYFPMAARAPNFPSAQTFNIPAPVTFLGTPMLHRIAVLSNLKDAGVPLAIYGKFWREGRIAAPELNFEKTFDDILDYCIARLRAEGIGALWRAVAWRLGRVSFRDKLKRLEPLLGGFLPGPEVPLLFRNSKINLGLTRIITNNPLRPGTTQMRLRDFEVPACGGFYLVERAPDYDGLFEDGKEVVTWRSLGELVEKIRYYIDHESERVAIAMAGQRRALREHLWQHRFSTLFARLGLG